MSWKKSRDARCPKCRGILRYIDRLATRTGLSGVEHTIVLKGRAMNRRIWWCGHCRKEIKTPLYK
jgi:hypothetical protein